MLSGKVAVVTGSSRVIGRAIAIAMGRAGASVMVTHQYPPDASAGPRKSPAWWFIWRRRRPAT